ncbi:hypothetical protein [Nocardioides sp. B-3]|uniref:hypothetical protein n=1 Tax=Nocardioides sp. B-3 TaxID=2895565 RepID=UPI0021523C5E|nr:hypothetical protein [Nocardioides sp. B-3]UUZ58248.1 hypothetical protein LP418_18620 [Nocardioides sp. B-3]
MAEYSTGQRAERIAHTVASPTTAPTTQRQPRAGSRPSGKQITVTVDNAIATTTGHVPSQPHQGLCDSLGKWPIWRPKNITAETTPFATKRAPSRWRGRWKST